MWKVWNCQDIERNITIRKEHTEKNLMIELVVNLNNIT